MGFWEWKEEDWGRLWLQLISVWGRKGWLSKVYTCRNVDACEEEERVREEGAEMALVLVDKQIVLAIKPQSLPSSFLPIPSSPLPMSPAPSPPIPPALRSYHPHTVQYSLTVPLQFYASSPSQLHLQWCSGFCSSSSGVGLVRSGLHQDVSLSSHLLSALLHACIRQSTSVQIHKVLLMILHSL